MAEMPTNGQTPKVDTFPTESQSLSEDIADQQFDINYADQRSVGHDYFYRPTSVGNQVLWCSGRGSGSAAWRLQAGAEKRQRRAAWRRRSGAVGSKKQRCCTEKRQQGAVRARSGSAALSLEQAGPGCGQEIVGAMQTLPTSSSSRRDAVKKQWGRRRRRPRARPHGGRCMPRARPHGGRRTPRACPHRGQVNSGGLWHCAGD
jgi:hypothetical protein